VVGLRDRVLIALMAYTFARVSAATAMKVEDYFVQGRRSWVRLYQQPTLPYNDFSANGNSPLNFVSQPKGALQPYPPPLESGGYLPDDPPPRESRRDSD
jgi:hypothetical protein